MAGQFSGAGGGTCQSGTAWAGLRLISFIQKEQHTNADDKDKEMPMPPPLPMKGRPRILVLTGACQVAQCGRVCVENAFALALTLPPPVCTFAWVWGVKIPLMPALAASNLSNFQQTPVALISGWHAPDCAGRHHPHTQKNGPCGGRARWGAPGSGC